jgi:hypothetical protein
MKLPTQEWGFAYLLLLALFVLAMTTALAHVTEESSFGLKEVILIFGMMGSGFVGWAFGSRERHETKSSEQPPKQ